MFNCKHPLRRALLLIAFAALVFSFALRPERLSGAFAYVWGALSCIIAGLCLAFILNLLLVPLEKPFVKLFKKHPRPRLTRALALLLTYVLALGLVALIIFSILPSLTDIADTIRQYLPNSLNDVPAWLETTLKRLGLSEQTLHSVQEALARAASGLSDYLNDIGSVAGIALNITTGVFGGLIDVVLTIALSAYILAGKEKLGRFTLRLSRAYLPEKVQNTASELSGIMYDKFSDFIKGQLIEAVILGIACFVGMLIFRFPNAGSISMMVGVSAIIPIIGPWVGAITGVLLNLIESPLKGLLFGVFIIVLQQLEDNIVYPRIVGRQMNVPGILVLVAVIIGAELGGMIGIILAVPMGAVIFELVRKHMAKRLSAAKAGEERSAGPS